MFGCTPKRATAREGIGYDATKIEIDFIHHTPALVSAR
jgi:hypothetical protein